NLPIDIRIRDVISVNVLVKSNISPAARTPLGARSAQRTVIRRRSPSNMSKSETKISLTDQGAMTLALLNSTMRSRLLTPIFK
ncbi:MAG: hypothetical protein WB696_16635, partial [Chthoniobacterales bacterium]